MKHMALQFPQCVAAATKGDTSTWELAYALAKEVGEEKSAAGKHDGSVKELEACRAEILAVVGVDYEIPTLRQFRYVGLNFPKDVRAQIAATGVKVAFHTCRSAGDPETLFKLIKALKPKLPKRHGVTVLSQIPVIKTIAAWKMQADRLHERAIEKQREQLERAKQAKLEAEARARKAKTDAERKRAEAAVAKAVEQIDEVKVAPKRNDTIPSEPDQMPAVMVPFDIEGRCNDAQEDAEYVIELLKNSKQQLDSESLVGIEKAINKTVALWQKAADLVERQQGNVVRLTRRG